MNFTTCNLLIGVSRLIGLYIGLLFLYALVSWIPQLRGRWTDYLSMVIEPVLLPLRRIIPPIGSLDISFLVLLLLLSFLKNSIVPRMCLYYT